MTKRREYGESDRPPGCPECGGSDWVTASDGLGSVASVATVCIGCGYLTTSVVDVSMPPDKAPRS